MLSASPTAQIWIIYHFSSFGIILWKIRDVGSLFWRNKSSLSLKFSLWFPFFLWNHHWQQWMIFVILSNTQYTGPKWNLRRTYVWLYVLITYMQTSFISWKFPCRNQNKWLKWKKGKITVPKVKKTCPFSFFKLEEHSR